MHHLGREQKITTVPEVPLANVFRGGVGIGLLDEAFHLEASLLVEGGPLRDVAIAGRGEARRDAEGHDVAVSRRPRRDPTGLREAFTVADDVIGGHDEDHRIGMFMGGAHRGDRDGRRRIAPHRLQDDVGRNPDLRQLLGRL